MNDRRFLELLNLYLDHELDPAEAAELEAEVMRNPARRRAYDQYCRLQRACSLLGEKERSLTPDHCVFIRSLRDAERKLTAPRRSIWNPVYIGGFTATAMAACVAVMVIVNRTPDAPLAGDSAAADTPPQAEQIAAVPVAATTTSTPSAAPAFEFQPAFAATGLGVVRNAREADIAANDREALEWMQRVELAGAQHVVVDDQAFEARPTLQADTRVFRSRHSLQGTAEFTAFQFQR